MLLFKPRRIKQPPGPKVSEEYILENILKVKQPTNAELMFESITMPPWTAYVTMHDVETLYWAATAKSLSGKSDKRRAAIKQVMEARGFKLMAGGTNRLTFKHLEDTTIVAKVAIDNVGLSDNAAEFKVQKLVFPRVTKMHQVCPTGVLGFAERVTPILTREEYNAYLPSIYTMLIEILGEYVMDDVGTDYFKNLGIRQGYGVVLLDYPYLYKLDGNKLYCNALENGFPCGGEIDYDPGLNHLYCTKCHRPYLAADLEDAIQQNQVVIKYKKGGKKPMRIRITKGDEVLVNSYNSDSIVRPSTQKRDINNKNIKFQVIVGGKVIAGDGMNPVETAKIQPTGTVNQTLSFPDPVIIEDEDEKEEESMTHGYIPTEIIVSAPNVKDPVIDPHIEEVVSDQASTITESATVEVTIPPEEETHQETVVAPTLQVTAPPPPKVEEFPPQNWGFKKTEEHEVHFESPSRMKPYYVTPVEEEDDFNSNTVITSRTKNPYNSGGFLGEDDDDE